jgi:hypothetical protein
MVLGTRSSAAASWPLTTSSDLLDADDCSGADGSGMVRT